MKELLFDCIRLTLPALILVGSVIAGVYLSDWVADQNKPKK